MKAIIIVALFALCSFKTQFEKTFTIKFSESSIKYHWQNMNSIKEIVDQSSLPHIQVVFILQSIDSLQREMNVQIVEQTKPK